MGEDTSLFQCVRTAIFGCTCIVRSAYIANYLKRAVVSETCIVRTPLYQWGKGCAVRDCSLGFVISKTFNCTSGTECSPGRCCQGLGPLIFYRVETSGVEYCLNPVTLSIVCADISTGLGRLNSAEIVALAATVKNTVKQRDTICTTAVPTGSAVTLMYLPRMVINRIAKIKKAVARIRGINYEI